MRTIFRRRRGFSSSTAGKSDGEWALEWMAKNVHYRNLKAKEKQKPFWINIWIRINWGFLFSIQNGKWDEKFAIPVEVEAKELCMKIDIMYGISGNLVVVTRKLRGRTSQRLLCWQFLLSVTCLCQAVVFRSCLWNRFDWLARRGSKWKRVAQSPEPVMTFWWEFE